MKSPFYLWLNGVVGQFIEGAADAFLIVTGGSALAQTGVVTMPTITPKQLGLSVLLGGAIYAASFLKKKPTPSAFAAESALTPVQEAAIDAQLKKFFPTPAAVHAAVTPTS